MNNKPIHPVQQIAEIIEQEGEKHEGTGFPWTLSAAKRILKETNPWISVQIKLPESGQTVIAYGSKGMKVCKYSRTLTWTGFRMKFVNLLSSGIWDDTITHWMPFPKPPQQ